MTANRVTLWAASSMLRAATSSPYRSAARSDAITATRAIALERKLARRAGGVCGGDQVPAVPRQESVALRQRLPMTHHMFNLRE